MYIFIHVGWNGTSFDYDRSEKKKNKKQKTKNKNKTKQNKKKTFPMALLTPRSNNDLC